MAKNLLLWLVIAAVLLSIFNNFSMQTPTERMVYSEFIQEIQRDQIRKVTIDGLTIMGERFDGSRFETTRPMVEDPKLIDDLLSTRSRSRGVSRSSRACGRSCWSPASRS
jgi:cell division protease FtsH